MAPLALVLFFALPAAADPPRNPCNAWSGTTARLPLRECGGIPENALRYAQACIKAFGPGSANPKLSSAKYVVIADWTVAQEFTRLYVLEWNQTDPYQSMNVLRGGLAHGSGNGSTAGETPTQMTDTINSYGTPGGCMRLFGTGAAGQMSTAPTMKAYRLDGLEPRNACVKDERGLYFHEYPGRVELRRKDDNVPASGKARSFENVELGRNLALGFSNGCVSLNETDFADISAMNIIPRSGGILFISWDGHLIPPKGRGAKNACHSATSVVPTPNYYEKVIGENMEAAQKALFSDPLATP